MSDFTRRTADRDTTQDTSVRTPGGDLRYYPIKTSWAYLVWDRVYGRAAHSKPYPTRDDAQFAADQLNRGAAAEALRAAAAATAEGPGEPTGCYGPDAPRVGE